MSKNHNVPQVRFRGVTDTWEQRKFGDLGSVAMCKRIFKEQTTDDGDVPFYKIGTFGGVADAYISRELFEEYKSKYSYPEIGDMLISASGTIGRTVEYIGKDEYFQDSNIVWFKHDERMDNSFLRCLYSIIKWSGIEGSTIKRLYNDNLLKTEFMLPSIEEQAKIGSYFRNLDNLITIHQRKCDSLKKTKKAMLQKMLPTRLSDGQENGENVPEIRFKGFTDAWEQRELGEVIKDNQKPIPKPTGEYIRLGIRSHAKGTFHEVVPEGGGLDVDTMYVVEANNLIVNITFAWEEAWAITSEEDAEKLVSHRFPQYIFNQGQYPVFYKYRLNNARMKYNLELASPGGAGRNRVLNKSAFLKIPVCIPTSYEEQHQIGTYFNNLDNLITLHQRKLETLKKLKKSMLQKMFPACPCLSDRQTAGRV